MKHLYAASLLTLVAAAATAASDEDYRYGRVRLAEPSLVLQRAAEPDAQEALPNTPFLPGDRVWSDGSGRAEFQLLDGSLLWLAPRTKLDYGSHESTDGERAALRLWSGSLAVRTWDRSTARVEVETPEALVRVGAAGRVRIDVERDTTRVSVREGRAEVETASGSWPIEEGQRTEVRRGDSGASAWRVANLDEDEFDAWVESHDPRMLRDTAGSEYLPEELSPYSAELDENGSWYHEDDVGYVWRPRVAVGWTPYAHGRWTWTAYGWTWVPYETWGWAPFHYGRWGMSLRLGWYWVPDRHWGPAWVSWALGGDHVGWCALDRWNRPVRHARRDSRSGHARDSWTFVRRGDFTARDPHRRRAAGLAPDSPGVRLFASHVQRPGRSLDAAVEARHPSFRRSARSTPLFRTGRSSRADAPATSTWRGERSDADPSERRRPQSSERSFGSRSSTRRSSTLGTRRSDEPSSRTYPAPERRVERDSASQRRERDSDNAAPAPERRRILRSRDDEDRPTRESGRSVMGRIFRRLESDRSETSTRERDASDSGHASSDRSRSDSSRASSERTRSRGEGSSSASRERSGRSEGASDSSRGRSGSSSGSRHPGGRRGN